MPPPPAGCGQLQVVELLSEESGGVNLVLGGSLTTRVLPDHLSQIGAGEGALNFDERPSTSGRTSVP